MTDVFLAPGAASSLACASCAGVVPASPARDACPGCGALLEVLHARPAESGAQLAARFRSRRGDPAGASGTASPDATQRTQDASGVWRFRELVMPGAPGAVSWPEGNTPLIEREPVREFAGVARLSLKQEGMNPTGSFKDRGMTVAVSDAVRNAASAVACASTGNTAASLAAYAAQAGLKALVFVPRGNVAAGKLAQATAYGARTLLVNGDFDACLTLARESSRELGVYLANSINPWRLEGQKTIVWELLEQLGWQSPDWIALPAGALGNTSAFGKALREAHALGLIAQVPRLLAVQAAGAAPFAQGYVHGFARRVKVRAETLATAIRIGDPASWDRAVRAIRETNGVVTMVSDADIMEAKAAVDAAGVGCEPASAASVAGVRAMVARGVIAAGAHVACVLTGHLLKDPDAVATFHAGDSARANRPIGIEPTVAEVRRVLALP